MAITHGVKLFETFNKLLQYDKYLPDIERPSFHSCLGLSFYLITYCFRSTRLSQCYKALQWAVWKGELAFWDVGICPRSFMLFSTCNPSANSCMRDVWAFIEGMDLNSFGVDPGSSTSFGIMLKTGLPWGVSRRTSTSMETAFWWHCRLKNTSRSQRLSNNTKQELSSMTKCKIGLKPNKNRYQSFKAPPSKLVLQWNMMVLTYIKLHPDLFWTISTIFKFHQSMFSSVEIICLPYLMNNVPSTIAQ